MKREVEIVRHVAPAIDREGGRKKGLKIGGVGVIEERYDGVGRQPSGHEDDPNVGIHAVSMPPGQVGHQHQSGIKHVIVAQLDDTTEEISVAQIAQYGPVKPGGIFNGEGDGDHAYDGKYCTKVGLYSYRSILVCMQQITVS